MSCPICRAEHFPTPVEGRVVSGEGPSCPYQGGPYAELRAGHDQIYFGRWRRMDASPLDIRKAFRQLDRLLGEISRVPGLEALPAARGDLKKAFDALHAAGPDEDGTAAVLHMDHALSYAHRVIGDLLHEKGSPPHSPADFTRWYDAAEVPFREDW